MIEHGFTKIDGGRFGLPTNENHINYKWNHPDYEIVFSVARQGNACSCHFACGNKKSIKKLRKAIDRFCNLMFRKHGWCKFIFAKVKKDSVGRLVKKCGFTPVADIEGQGVTVYAKAR
jgi:citrate lyase synthetase